MKLRQSIFCLVGLLAIPLGLTAQLNWHRTVCQRDLNAALVPDFYQSYTSLYYTFISEQKLYIWQEREYRLYRDLLLQSLKPKTVLIELTLYPATYLASYVGQQWPDFFDRLTLTDNFNLLETLGGGIQEPWSVSLFLGQLAPFLTLDENEELVIAATGISGLVVTFGNCQVFDNILVPSQWGRLEWKLKGEGLPGSDEYSWDIKVGYRWYGLSAIDNTLTLFLSRTKITRQVSDWHLAENSLTELEVQVPFKSSWEDFSRITLTYGKFLPLRKWMVGVKTGIGYEYRKTYSMPEKQFSARRIPMWDLFIQPVIIF